MCAYFDAVMRQHLLPSGRVTYLPMSEYLGDGRIRTLGGEDIEVTARRVVTSHVDIIVPSMRPPSYAVEAVDCVPPNELPRIRDARDRYVIVGAGKTAMDACLWLLRHGVAAERLTWIKPRDSWVLDRAAIQPGSQFAKRVLRDFSNQLAAVHEAESLPDLFDRLESKGCLLRVDQSVDPTMYRCAILSHAELDELRRIEDVVRMGHVQSIEPGRITLEGGTLDIEGSALYIDCTRRRFRASRTDRRCSAATTSPCRRCAPANPRSARPSSHMSRRHIPMTNTRNAFCGPVPYPREPTDWLRMMLAFNKNQLQWFSDPDMMAWVDAARLNVLHHVTAAVSERAREKIISVLSSQLPAINDKLEQLLAG